jgi:hypothetical protein
LSFADYVWVRDKPWKEWDPNSPPSFYKTSNKGADDKGDVYLEPDEYGSLFAHASFVNLLFSSFILKIKAAEIVASGTLAMVPRKYVTLSLHCQTNTILDILCVSLELLTFVMTWISQIV